MNILFYKLSIDKNIVYDNVTTSSMQAIIPHYPRGGTLRDFIGLLLFFTHLDLIEN